MSQEASPQKEDKNIRRFSARFHAVQSVYESLINHKHLPEIAAVKIADLKEERTEEANEDSPTLIEPDGALYQKIINGIAKEKEMLLEIIMRHKSGSDTDQKPLEPLIKALCLCGSYELYAHQDIDAPIIINDYLDVAYSYYQKGEISLINGLLDAMASSLRPS